MNDLWINVGRLYGDQHGYEKEVAISQCIRGCEKMGVDWSEVQGDCRLARIIDVKRMCCMLLRKKTWGYQSIAEAVGLTNHATASHHAKRGNELLEYDPEFRDKYQIFIAA